MIFLRSIVLCVFLFLSAFLLPLVASFDCIDKCNALFALLPKAYICGSDGKDYHAPLEAIVGLPPPWTCYHDCNVGVFYPGSCGCPNACNENANKGKCDDGKCECADGWGGADCSSVVCPHNKCSNNGKCISITKHTDACDCDSGYTGDDCSIAALNISTLPFGEVLPGGPYYHKDKYGDQHPVFDVNRIANIRLRLDDDDFQNMFVPANTWNLSYVDGSFTFSNGKLQENFDKIGIKLKGHFARMAVKKSFVIKFKKDKFFGLKHLVLKAPSLDPSYLHSQLLTEFYRAMRVPTVRGSFATLTVNEVYYGLYWMYEELDEDFAKTRYGNDDGNLYTLNTFLRNLGDDPQAYQELMIDNMGRKVEAYKQEFGDGNFEDLAQLAQFINETDISFSAQLENILNVDYFIRAMIILSATDNSDSSPTNGNNWAMYDFPINKSTTLWQYIPKDHEKAFINPIQDPYKAVESNEQSISHRILAMPQYHQTFNDYYVVFLKKILDPSLEVGVKSRIRAFDALLKNIVKTDQSYHITYGLPLGKFAWDVVLKETEIYLDLRYKFLSKHFDV